MANTPTLTPAQVATIGASISTSFKPWLLTELAAQSTASTPPVTTPPAPPPPHADSAQGAMVKTPTDAPIYLGGKAYALTTNKQIMINGKLVTSSAAVVSLKLVGSMVEQTNATGDTWTQPADGSAGTFVSHSPVVPVTPPPNNPPSTTGGSTPTTTPMPTTGGSTTPTLHITDWSGFKTSAGGDSNTWANSIPPGQNRSLNAGAEWEFYLDDTNLPAGVPSPFAINGDKHLVITAFPHDNGWSLLYSSGCCSSHGFFNQTYGFFSAKMQLPDGPGWWPAFWMLPSSLVYTGENDIMERWNSENQNVHQTLHGTFGGTWTTPNCVPTLNSDITNWHDYACDWRSDYITYFVDGVQTGKFPTPDGMKEPNFIIFNLAVFHQNTWSPPPDSGASASMTIAELLVLP